LKVSIYVICVTLASMVLLVGISPILPARAQEPPPVVHARVIIRTPDGEQVIELDPSQLPKLGEGNHVIIMRDGSNGEISAFAGDPEMLNNLGGPGFSFGFPGGGNGGAYGGLNIIDPGVSYLYALLKRIDVAQEIRLNARQREALDAAEKNQQETRQSQLKQGIQVLTQDLQGKSQDEIRFTMTERAQKMQEQVKTFADARMKALASVLKPDQLARLKELDLQYRGPMAMGVNEVADQATLTKEQTSVIAGVLKEYRQEVNKNLNFGVRTISFKPGSAPAASPPASPPNSEEMRVKLVKADKEIRKSRLTLSAKALATLPSQQRAQWSKLSGKPFEFHPAL
jgi:hypothetical protein